MKSVTLCFGRHCFLASDYKSLRNLIIAAAKPWTLAGAEQFCRENSGIKTYILTERSELTLETLNRIKPDYVFFPHWSWYIPPEIFTNYTCVIFHPSDVPFGRGGTPIQNLIAVGYTETFISAIKATEELDGGDVFMKCKLSLLGGGEEILIRMHNIIFREMIPFILKNKIIPKPQIGKVTAFKRRTPEMSELNSNMTMTQIFDAIRMLDIESYPKAFIRFGEYIIAFSRATLRTDGIEATIKLSKGV